MQIQKVLDYLEILAPLSYAEDFDNAGLLVGDPTKEVNNILVTLDTLEITLDEAISKKCNLIISFHPIIFKGLKKLTGKNYVERVVIEAIKNNIAIYALHTALDNIANGVSGKMATVLGLKNQRVLAPKPNMLKKLKVYVPIANADEVREGLFKAGAGHIGNYAHCSFNSEGTGTYLPNENANPSIGEIGKLQREPETAIEVYFEKNLENDVLQALFKIHPYEEIAYGVTPLDNKHQHIGLGIYGELPKAMNEKNFLKKLKTSFKTTNIRHSILLNKPIKKVAVLGGSGSFYLSNALAVNADAYVSADFKYHDFFGAENRILIADIGHYESEQFTKELLAEYLIKKITNFAPAFSENKVIIAETNTNPIFNY